VQEPSEPTPPETPRREFRFKPTEFERTNRPVDEDDNQPAIDLRTLYRQANAASPPARPAEPPAENEVHEILRANLERAKEDGLDELILRPKRLSRRKQDYWLLLIGGNVLFAGLVLLMAKNIVSLVFGGSGMIFYSLALTWIMWFVMDDY